MPIVLLADIYYILALFSSCLIITESHICKEVSILCSISCGADAVNAIRGAFDNAHNPPG